MVGVVVPTLGTAGTSGRRRLGRTCLHPWVDGRYGHAALPSRVRGSAPSRGATRSCPRRCSCSPRSSWPSAGCRCGAGRRLQRGRLCAAGLAASGCRWSSPRSRAGPSTVASLVEPELSEPARRDRDHRGRLLLVRSLPGGPVGHRRGRGDADLGVPAATSWSRATTTSPTCSSSAPCWCRRSSSAGWPASSTSRPGCSRSSRRPCSEQAVRAERDRIARELHDVIAHSVSAMVVQTAAARDLVTTDPARAQQVLDGVTGTGRRALAETARLLHVIRDDADELGLEPVPGVADLDRLVEEFTESGLQVDLEQSGDLGGLPAGVDVSTYRIVQEALTNARRYGAGPVSLEVRRQNGSVRIAATNPVGPERRRTVPASGCSAWPSGRRCSAAACATTCGTGGSSWRPCCRWVTRDHRPDRGRPGPGPQRAGDGGRRPRLRGRRDRRRRARGRPAHPRARAGRRADGHPDAGARRDRGDPGDRRRVAAHPGARADDVRRRHLCLRRARRRGRRVPPQGDPAGPAGRGHPHRRGGRGAPRADAHPEADRGARPPPGAVRRGAGGPVGPDRARGRGARADRARPVQRRDRRRRWSSRRRR